MSAIAGVFYRNGAPGADEALTRMMGRMRRPDGRGRWSRDAVALGHLDLRSLPPERWEAMPLHDEERGIVLSADARIDNRDDLCRRLGIAPAEHNTLSDGALIRLAYERWGLDCPEHLVGDYAFALWDERERRFLCATDPMGRRPLYYHLGPHLFAFASEAGALLGLPGVPARLDETGLSNVLVGGVEAEDPERTCLEGIRVLPAGRLLVVEAAKTISRAYWRPVPKRLPYRKEADFFEAFRELFEEAVRCRTRSPGPVASLLSGGLDSSAIVCMAARMLRREGRSLIPVASVLSETYEGPERDERYYIDLVRDQERLEVAYETAEERPLFGESLERYFGKTGSFSATYYPYRYDALFHAAAERGARVMLDGVGGEFGPTYHGYGFHASLALRGRWVRLAREVRAMAERQGVSPMRIWRSRVIAPLLPPFVRAKYKQKRKGEGLFAWLEHSVIHPEFAARSGVVDRVRRSSALIPYPHRSIRANQMWMLGRARQPATHWWREQGVETVFPYQDVRLIEFCLGLPDEMYVRDGWKRYLLRGSMEGVLPPEIRWRTTKEPFSPDHTRRLWHAREELCQWLETVREEIVTQAFIDVEKVAAAVRRVRACSDADSAMASPSVQRELLTLQHGLYATRFLRWFEEAKS